MLNILTAPDKVLTTPAKPVHKIDKRIKKLVLEMEETLINQSDPQGVGLAAPQVGYSLALFIIKTKPSAETQVFINPKVLQMTGELVEKRRKKRKHDGSQKDEEKMEGCLSVPRIWAPLKRAKKVQISYLDLEGQTHTNWFSGLNSIIVQHEIDHLAGVLFTQRSLEQKATLYEEKGDRLVKIKTV